MSGAASADAPRRRAWLRAALLAALVYAASGLVFGALAGAAATHRMTVAWRLAAWVASAVAFAAQIVWEHVRLRSAPRSTAWHAAVAAAFGSFALAAAANVHETASAGHARASIRLALVLWPVLTAVPAFLVAYALAAGLARLHRTP